MRSAFVFSCRNMSLLVATLVLASLVLPAQAQESDRPAGKQKKLYWFIPDGMRADPDVFDVYQWAREGELPNIKWMMDHGSYGYSIPTFPSHTPTNFATLFTGAYPLRHGVSDGPMHTAGNPLSNVSIGGFSSAAKKINPIWVTMEKLYDENVVLLSVPGSTPPELEKGITIRGRWGGWGADFHATNFEEEGDNENRFKQGRGARLFFFGPPLTKYKKTEMVAEEAALPLQSYSTIKEARLDQYGKTVYAYLYDSTDNQKTDYDRVAFSFGPGGMIADLKEGQWSDWMPVTLTWQELPVQTSFKIKVIKLGEDGFFRFRFFYNNLNKHVTKPAHVAEEIVEGVGPMVDFVDNFPPQLIFYDEDKQCFLEEARMSLEWHKKAADFILNKYHPDIFINDTYTPNQMLTSRWWMGYVDPSSARYSQVSQEIRKQLWSEVKEVYKKLDEILGQLLKHADENTYVILSSDHGAVPLDKAVMLNNLFAQKGWLKFKIDPQTGEPIIDWENSKVIYLKMAYVYISPDGLGGNWHRASGKAYEELRKEVRNVLVKLKDEETGIKPVVAVYNWEDAPEYLQLPTDRIGDLVIVNEAGYGWDEEMTEDGRIFDIPLESGYKQAVFAERKKGMWTPFVIVGPGIKKGYRIKKPIHHIDQYPTIMTFMGKKVGGEVDGRVLNEIFE